MQKEIGLLDEDIGFAVHPIDTCTHYTKSMLSKVYLYLIIKDLKKLNSLNNNCFKSLAQIAIVQKRIGFV